MMLYLRNLVLVLTLASIPGMGFGKKPLGEVVDADTLLKVQSYCVDMDKIDSSAVSDVRRFLDKQNQPKGTLGKLPWKLVENCAQADAVVSLKFGFSVRVTGAGGSAPGSTVPLMQPTYSVRLLVVDGASQKPLYQVEGESGTASRERSVSSLFSKLIHDLKTLSR